jgi:chaperonin GroEL
VAEGIVPGGGVALVRCIDALDKLKVDDAQRYGVEVVRRALEEPLRQIAKNAGADPSVVVMRVRDGGKKEGAGYGFNAETEVFEDLVAAGVIDPTKVVRAALQNAASVAGLMLTTEAIMAERPEKFPGLTPYPQTSPDLQPQAGPPRRDDDWEDH